MKTQFRRILLAALGAALFSLSALAAVPIKIVSATYGCLCEPPANCDATAFIAAHCDGKASCLVSVGPQLCGGRDPTPNSNHLLVVFQCGSATLQDLRADKGQELRLSCP